MDITRQLNKSRNNDAKELKNRAFDLKSMLPSELRGEVDEIVRKAEAKAERHKVVLVEMSTPLNHSYEIGYCAAVAVKDSLEEAVEHHDKKYFNRQNSSWAVTYATVEEARKMGANHLEKKLNVSG